MEFCCEEACCCCCVCVRLEERFEEVDELGFEEDDELDPDLREELVSVTECWDR